MSSSNQVNIPLFVPSAPKDSSLPPTLQLYSHSQTSHHPLDDSLLVPTPHPLRLQHSQLNLIFLLLLVKVYVLPVIPLHIILL